jgi:hypothetical protein
MPSLRVRHLLPLVLAVAALAARPAGAAAQVAQPGTLHVLTVGVNGSEKRTFGTLRFADKDAKDVADLFKAQDGRLYARVQVRTLTNAEATRARARKELRDLERSAGPNDMVVVFLSGHGGRSLLRGWSFETYDAGAADGGLSVADLRGPLGAIAQRKVPVLLFLDTCHAGAVDLSDCGVVVFASSQAEQSSVEFAARSNGLYTVALTEGLRGRADRNHDGTITLEELNRYLEVRVGELVEECNKERPTRPVTQKHRLHRAAATDAQLALAHASRPGVGGKPDKPLAR